VFLKRKSKKQIAVVLFFVFLVAGTTATQKLYADVPDVEQLTDKVSIVLSTEATVYVKDNTLLSPLKVNGIPVKAVHMSTTIDAPIGVRSLPKSLDANLIPNEQDKARDDYSLELLLASASYQYKNTTEGDFGTGDLSDNFNSETYKYLALKRMKAVSVSSNVSIVVSYSDSTSGNISDSADTTNTTIFNEPLPYSHTYWFRLDLEATNSSRMYVINIKLTNIHADSIFIFSSSTDMKDTRYLNCYFDESDTPVSTLLKSAVNPETPYGYDSLLPSTLWPKLFQTPPDPYTDYKKVNLLSAGWETADKLEDELEAKWAHDSADIDSTDDIVDYQMSKMRFGFSLDTEEAAAIYKALKDRYELTDDARELLAYLKDNYFKTVTIGTDIKPSELDDIDAADTADEVSNGFYAAITRAMGRVNSFAVDILNRTVDAVGRINTNVAAFISAKLNYLTEDLGLSPIVIIMVILGGLALVVLVVLRMVR